MKQFLIGSFILAFLLGSAPAMAESEHRRGMLSHTSGADRDRASAHHNKFLTSRYRDDDRYRSGHSYRGHKYRGHDRKGHGWRGHKGKHKGWKRGWKQEKWHHRKHRYHGHKRHHDKHRHHPGHDSGYRYRFRYNGVLGADGGPVISGGQIMIDLSRR